MNKNNELSKLFQSVPDFDHNKYTKFTNIRFNLKPNSKLWCFTDVHIGHRSWDKPKFHEAIKKVMEDPQAYCFFNGDQLDFTPGGHHNAMNEQIMTNQEQVEYFNKLLKLLGKKCLAIRHGNHEQRQAIYTDNALFDEYCKLLKIPVLATGMDRFFVDVNKKEYTVLSSHGIGGSSQKVLQQMQLVSSADVYFSGHTHEFYNNYTFYRKGYDSKTKQDSDRPIVLLAGGSFQGWDGHARDRNMRPTNSGCHVLTFTENDIKVEMFT